jgi:hypothetical protein
MCNKGGDGPQRRPREEAARWLVAWRGNRDGSGGRHAAYCAACLVAPEDRVSSPLGASHGVMARRAMSGPGAPSLQRHPSTAGTALPTPGARCSCCYGIRWWRARSMSYGWCCGSCHPPDHLKSDEGLWEPPPQPTESLL